MTRPTSIAHASIALASILLLAGCGHSPPTRFLTLDVAPPAAAPAIGRVPPLRVVAVHVPATIDRMEFVTVPGPGRIAVHDQDRWAAAPGLLAREALVRDLAMRVPPGGVLPIDAGPAAGSWRVDVDILAIDAGADGATLTGVATLVRDDGRGSGAPIRLTLRLVDPIPIDTGDERERPVATARAYGRLLGQAADRIVAAMAGT